MAKFINLGNLSDTGEINISLVNLSNIESIHLRVRETETTITFYSTLTNESPYLKRFSSEHEAKYFLFDNNLISTRPTKDSTPNPSL